MTGLHARAARALLGWTQGDLAKRANVGVRTIARIENGEDVTALARTAVARAFEDGGVRIFAHVSEIEHLDVETGLAIITSPS